MTYNIIILVLLCIVLFVSLLNLLFIFAISAVLAKLYAASTEPMSVSVEPKPDKPENEGAGLIDVPRTVPYDR